MFVKIILGVLIILVVYVVFLVVRFQLQKIKENKLGWRTRSFGRDAILYQEKIDSEWQKIEIYSEILLGEKSKVIYFKSAEEWKEYPEWAQHREEIIQRIKISYPEKNTAYEND